MRECKVRHCTAIPTLHVARSSEFRESHPGADSPEVVHTTNLSGSSELASRTWCSCSTLPFQGRSRGSNPRVRSIRRSRSQQPPGISSLTRTGIVGSPSHDRTCPCLSAPSGTRRRGRDGLCARSALTDSTIEPRQSFVATAPEHAAVASGALREMLRRARARDGAVGPSPSSRNAAERSRGVARHVALFSGVLG